MVFAVGETRSRDEDGTRPSCGLRPLRRPAPGQELRSNREKGGLCHLQGRNVRWGGHRPVLGNRLSSAPGPSRRELLSTLWRQTEAVSVSCRSVVACSLFFFSIESFFLFYLGLHAVSFFFVVLRARVLAQHRVYAGAAGAASLP